MEVCKTMKIDVLEKTNEGAPKLVEINADDKVESWVLGCLFAQIKHFATIPDNPNIVCILSDIHHESENNLFRLTVSIDATNLKRVVENIIR